MFFASSHGSCLFPIRTVWAAVAPSARGWWPAIQRLLLGAVPTPSANAPETQCVITACVEQSCHKLIQDVKPALPTASTALLRSAKQPARRFGSTLPPNRRAGFGLQSPWITLPQFVRSALRLARLHPLALRRRHSPTQLDSHPSSPVAPLHTWHQSQPTPGSRVGPRAAGREIDRRS